MPPPVVDNCPFGLEYLTQIDQLLVKQQVELLEGELSFLFFVLLFSRPDLFGCSLEFSLSLSHSFCFPSISSLELVYLGALWNSLSLFLSLLNYLSLIHSLSV